jgi:chromosomal replication initiation ATPase DnaA
LAARGHAFAPHGLSLPQQLPFPFGARTALTREDFVPSLASAPALAFIDSWPNWPVAAAALHGPAGSGKTHLAAIWQARSNAQVVSAKELSSGVAHDPVTPLIIEDVDSARVSPARDAALFALLEHAQVSAPVLLTGHEPPSAWKTTLPDLASRFSALLAFPLWAPDDELLAAIARKLFNDRQLTVPDAVIARMVTSLERSPSAMRDFVARADEQALAQGRAINLALVREMLAENSQD